MNKQELKSLLGKDAVDEVLSQLENYARDKGRKDLLNQIILQRNRVQGYLRHQQNDTLPPDEIRRLKNQVVEGLLSIIDSIDDNEITKSKPAAALKWFWMLGIPALLLVITIGYLQYRSFSGHPDTSTASKAGNQNLPDATSQARRVVFPKGEALSFRSVSGEQTTYTFLNGRITPADEQTMFLTVSIRCENLDDYDINFWDRSFRLKIADPEQYLAPVSNLNEIVASRSIKTGDIVFEIPSSVAQASLEVQSPFGNGQKRQLAVSIQ